MSLLFILVKDMVFELVALIVFEIMGYGIVAFFEKNIEKAISGPHYDNAVASFFSLSALKYSHNGYRVIIKADIPIVEV
ncbi:hypothetical protein BSR14_08645 [Streptococcus salivarius]|uniref:hypothetical protein n=2 Tax=Streptococcus salivarius TaxID=1304 RepID=UPI0012E1CB26|nr:hypothetical protein [Streptococcus salivarius]MBT1029252.1 hypothetical protein [Streptococcus salivarius]QGU79278.1 hypothetical protein BSR14_08645 [Streptococcus salivarius]QGU83291.1 hypothetical protein BSR20_08650 [Streptococcus salivarius]